MTNIDEVKANYERLFRQIVTHLVNENDDWILLSYEANDLWVELAINLTPEELSNFHAQMTAIGKEIENDQNQQIHD